MLPPQKWCCRVSWRWIRRSQFELRKDERFEEGLLMREEVQSKVGFIMCELPLEKDAYMARAS
ncbi:hypothetical protein glysoja_046806 [Glycine soja]|uniref:Uncharacterized protein n=1 Tax=Glycine soja TaxID=3848 RepID=A0A0B2P8Q1_GLYSO|nr:hypothetical protein glysoja_046806 [Glycine soja]